MFIKVSHLIGISLMFLVGCSKGDTDSSTSNSSGSEISSSHSFLGCWKGGPPYDGVSAVLVTYVFESNNTYSAKNEIRSQHLNQNFTWTGRWEHDADYIVAVSDDDGKKATFKILSDYELNQVGQSFNYSRC